MTEAASNGRSDEVDTLRAFAMLAVLALHSHLLPIGWMGVWLFYVISGYVVTLSVIARDRGERPLSRLGGFLRRRAARILPIYYLYICAGLIVALAMGLPQHATSIASLILFFDNIMMIVGDGRINGWPTGHLWTLSTEMQFYALYGMALCLLPRRHTHILLIALLIACPVVRLIVGQWLSMQGWTTLDAAFAVYAGPGLHFDIFAMGALLAFHRTARPDSRASYPLLRAGIVAVTLYTVIYAAINVAIRHESGIDATRNILSGILFGQLREVFLYSVIGLFMTGLVAFAAERVGGPGGRILRIPALQWIGRISYGGYLLHPLALKGAMMMLAVLGLQTRGGGVVAHGAQFAVALPLTLLLAWLSSRFLETPLRMWIDGNRKTASTNAANPKSLFGLGAS